MTVDEAKLTVERARNRDAYIDLENPDEGVALDGRFSLETLEAIIVLVRAEERMPIKWSGEDRG